MSQALVMLIDPHPTRRAEWRRLVEQLPGRALEAADGQAALAVLQDQPVDLVVCARELDNPTAAEICDFLLDFFSDPPATLLLVSDPSEQPAAIRAEAVLAWPQQRSSAALVMELLLRGAELQTRLRAIEAENREFRRLANRLARQQVGRLPSFELFKRVLVMELRKARRYRYPLAVLLVKLDNSAKVLGWLEPEQRAQLLLTVWERLQQDLRDTDLPLQFAEDRLLVVLPHTGIEGATVLADRIRHHLDRLEPPASMVELPLTVSVAVASTEHHQRVELGGLIGLAMRGLREAELKGGNLVIVCGEHRDPDKGTESLPESTGQLGDRIFFL